MPAAWSSEEVEAVVADYFVMLSAELRGEAYNKAEHRRRLLPVLQDRTDGAIERKHGNISAALIELGMPYIEGYKPYINYQRLLFDVIEARLSGSSELETIVAADVEAQIVAPSVDDILAALVDAPLPARRVDRALVREGTPERFGTTNERPRANYIRREAENSILGAAGEEFVFAYEQARLLAARQERLASRIEHVSKTRGDGDGFDILSFEESGEERLIEVKTTKYGAQTPFFVSRNEVAVSERESDHYHLYRVFAFRKTPKLFAVSGSLRSQFTLSATQFLAKIA